MEWKERINQRLSNIYGTELSDSYRQPILSLVQEHLSKIKHRPERWNQEQIILITYGDSLIDGSHNPLEVLHEFLNQHLKNKITHVHILPFFPYSSDDGFSVIDFKQVNPQLGNWENVKAIGNNYRLMFDLVINHASSQGKWFKNFKRSEGEGHDFFIVPPPDADLSKVVRPRNTPLLTTVETKEGTKRVWTTFSQDQVDLNFSNPLVLKTMLEVLIFYIQQGAKVIRLDAIAFLWKEWGTDCLHLFETHEVVKLIRDVAGLIDPEVIILTETNVPNKENLSYFGKNDEAHMVYQFSLPPLLLHALNSGNSKYLTQWATTVPELPTECTFFNFTASHDGIGVRPLEGLLPETEKEKLYQSIRASGGLISMKSNADGTESPYELNITYFDALKRTQLGLDDLQLERFIASQTIMLSMKGIPAMYIHSLLGSENYYKGVEQTGRARSINREQLKVNALQKELEQDSCRKKVFEQLKHRMTLRQNQIPFHPSGQQKVFDYGSPFFVIERTYQGKNLLSITNMTREQHCVAYAQDHESYGYNLIKSTSERLTDFAPYETKWLIK